MTPPFLIADSKVWWDVENVFFFCIVRVYMEFTPFILHSRESLRLGQILWALEGHPFMVEKFERWFANRKLIPPQLQHVMSLVTCISVSTVLGWIGGFEKTKGSSKGPLENLEFVSMVIAKFQKKTYKMLNYISNVKYKNKISNQTRSYIPSLFIFTYWK